MPDSPPGMDREMWLVSSHLRMIDDFEDRLARVFRETFDQIYDGIHTGRFRWDQLRKTEKTHFGSIVEINIQREFGFDDGEVLDFSIGGVEVDCKYSQDRARWMIPVEAVDQVILGLTANDATSKWSAGLVRCRPEHLTGGGNRDLKRQLNPRGRDAINWIWDDAEFPPNVLLQLDADTLDRILTKENGRPRSGQQRLNQLFRLVQGRRIPRGTIETLGQQKDPMKRVRQNSGSRSHLQADGIVILGDGLRHRELAAQLGLPVPQKSEFVAARLYPAEDDAGVMIDGGYWRLAKELDPVVPAPALPKD